MGLRVYVCVCASVCLLVCCDTDAPARLCSAHCSSDNAKRQVKVNAGFFVHVRVCPKSLRHGRGLLFSVCPAQSRNHDSHEAK